MLLESATHGRSVEAQPNYSVKRLVRWIFVAFGGLIAIGSAFYMAECQRVRNNQTWLNALQAQYSWHYKQPSGQNSVRSILARELGPSFVSDISTAEIFGKELDDAQLERIDSLRQLQSLAVSSQMATDLTLKKISDLPNLTRLTLTGERFTFLGLLQLRKLASLESLALHGMSLSPSEICVLESALPEVSLSYDCDVNVESYTRPMTRRFTTMDHQAILRPDVSQEHEAILNDEALDRNGPVRREAPDA